MTWTREGWIYLNNASVTPAQPEVRAAIDRFLDLSQASGTVRYREVFTHVEEVRAWCAELIGAPPRHVFFPRNTTAGLNAFALSFPFSPTRGIALPEHEFPANVRPWLHASARSGAPIRWVPMPDHRVEGAAVDAALDAGAEVLAISQVQYLGGFRADLVDLGARCRARGAWLVVDAVQGLGCWPLDVGAVQPDLVSASSHKALGCLEGIGIGYASERVLQDLPLPWGGWLSLAEPWRFAAHDQAYAPDARRFEEGSPNVVGIFGLGAAVQAVLTRGVAAIEAHLLQITARLLDVLDGLGLEVISPRDDAHRSHIVSFRPPRPGLVQALEARRVVVIEREGCVRVSPTWRNTGDDIEAFARALKDALAEP